MSKPKPLQLPPEGIRQSLLAGFETCGRRTRFSLQTLGDWATGYVEVSADLGKMFHLFARDYLRILYRTGESNMAPNDAVEVMHETVSKADFVLPADERDDLVWLVRGFAHFKWDARRISSLEERLEANVAGPDGIVRTITGAPDMMLTDPDSAHPGIVIVDYKTGRSKPPSPRGQPDTEYAEGKQYLSERGHFQLDCYGVLGLHATPIADHVTLRELHLRTGQIREATLTRDELQYVERQLGNQAMLLERAIAEGPKSQLFAPRAGSHCAHKCPVSSSCPIPREQRGVGGIATDRQADRLAEALCVAKSNVELWTKQLKARFEGTGYVPTLPSGEHYRWHETGTGKRGFGVCPPDAPWDPKTLRRKEELQEVADQEANLEGLLAESIKQVQGRDAA